MSGIDRVTAARSRQARPRLNGVAVAATPLVLAFVFGACGTTDQASKEPLPPIRTTTSTTTIPGTTLPEGVRRFWVIERGDTLASIAASTGVTVQSIIDLNNIQNPDNIPAGETIEIPADVVVLNSPGASTTTTSADG